MREMIEEAIRLGEWVPNDVLWEEFRSALEKKREMMKLRFMDRPRPWETEFRTTHLLWGAILLENAEFFLEIERIAAREETEAYEFQRDELGMSRSHRGALVPTERIIASDVNELLNLAPNPVFRNALAQKVKRTLPKEIYSKRYLIDEKGDFRMELMLK